MYEEHRIHPRVFSARFLYLVTPKKPQAEVRCIMRAVCCVSEVISRRVLPDRIGALPLPHVRCVPKTWLQ